MPKGIALGFAFVKTKKSFWDNQLAPNSESEMLIPSIGVIWNHKDYGSFSLNVKYNDNTNISESSIKNKASMFELSFGYRKTLNYTIPWLSDY